MTRISHCGNEGRKVTRCGVRLRLSCVKGEVQRQIQPGVIVTPRSPSGIAQLSPSSERSLLPRCPLVRRGSSLPTQTLAVPPPACSSKQSRTARKTKRPDARVCQNTVSSQVQTSTRKEPANKPRMFCSVLPHCLPRRLLLGVAPHHLPRATAI